MVDIFALICAMDFTQFILVFDPLSSASFRRSQNRISNLSPFQEMANKFNNIHADKEWTEVCNIVTPMNTLNFSAHFCKILICIYKMNGILQL